MHVIIIGAGKVGFTLAQRLSREDHDVVMVEQDESRCRVVQEHLDVQTVVGNGATPRVLEEAGVKTASMTIAVTDVDEANLLACMAAKRFGCPRTIARVRDSDHLEHPERVFTRSEWADLMINADLVTAAEVGNRLASPAALDMEDFAGGRVRVLEFKLDKQCRLVGKPLKQVRMPASTLVAAILREDRMIIPRGHDRMLVGDRVFVVGRTGSMSEVEKLLGSSRRPVRQVMILGGGRTGVHLARILEQRRVSVKLVERDLARCEAIARELSRSLVLHGDGNDLDLLKAEGVGDMDAFVALTGDDKMNVLVALWAKHLGAQKTIVQVKRSDYIALLEHVGIDVAISPRLMTAGVILRMVRRSGPVSVSLLEGARAEVMELVAPAGAGYLQVPLSALGVPQGALIGAIARGDQVIVPGGSDAIEAGDRLVVFTLSESVAAVEQLFAGQGGAPSSSHAM